MFIFLTSKILTLRLFLEDTSYTSSSKQINSQSDILKSLTTCQNKYMHDGIFRGTNFFLVWLIVQQVKYKFTNRIIATD